MRTEAAIQTSGHRLTRRIAALANIAALGGCIGTGPVSQIESPAQAIAIAKDRCAWTQPFAANEEWRAALHQGQWHVWLVRDRDSREPVVGALDVWIRGRDGKAGDCNHAN